MNTEEHGWGQEAEGMMRRFWTADHADRADKGIRGIRVIRGQKIGAEVHHG